MENPVAIERGTMEDIADAIRERQDGDYYIPQPKHLQSAQSVNRADSIIFGDDTDGARKISFADSVAFYDQFFQYALYNYDGINIAEKFAGEMGITEPWVWIQQRLANKDVNGLHIKDWFEVTVNNNTGGQETLQMQIADINHDLHFMGTTITKWHIDFISKDLWPERHVWNKKNYNNGISTETCPWLASDLKAWLNSEVADVPNATTADPTLEHVDYTSTGVRDKLPESLRNVIVERQDYAPARYSAEGLLTDNIGWGPWKNIGKLWVPNETEVYGQVVWGTQNGYSVGTSHQFPIFMDGKTRIKGLGRGGSRNSCHLRSVVSGDSTDTTYSNVYGCASRGVATNANVGAPVCFRISA